MMDINGNLFDIAFLVIVLVLGLLAFLRGFIREIFSVLNWILALFATYGLAPVTATLFSSLIGGIISQTALFMVSLIIISIFTSKISKPLNKKMPLLINQPLGLAFGVTKAYLVVALFFSIIITIYSYDLFPLSEHSKQEKGRIGPDWLQTSISYEILEVGAEFLQPVTDAAIDSIKQSALKGKNITGGQIMKKMDDLDELKEQGLDESQKYYEEEGYDMENIYQMQNLIETIRD